MGAKFGGGELLSAIILKILIDLDNEFTLAIVTDSFIVCTVAFFFLSACRCFGWEAIP